MGAATTWITCSRMNRESPWAEGVDPGNQALTVHEKMEETEMVEGEKEDKEREEKDERLDEDFQLFLQRTGPPGGVVKMIHETRPRGRSVRELRFSGYLWSGPGKRTGHDARSSVAGTGGRACLVPRVAGNPLGGDEGAVRPAERNARPRGS